ncbi:MAG: antitoxin [Oscillospiraceae bacterium]|nr:antitoxin [Oscillospiraceae bacterium]
MSFSIRLSAEEKNLAESYAKLHSMSVGEAFKKALFEKIEDEYDIAIAREAHAEYVADGEKSRPISELWKELDL